jgi:3'-5' exoribonuclease
VPKIFVEDIEANQEVASHFILADKQLRTARNGTQFLTLKLADKTGELTGRIWDGAVEAAAALPARGVVSVRGRSELYRDEMQLQVREIAVLPMEQLDPADYLPVCPADREELWEKLKKLCSSVKNKPLHQLLKTLLGDKCLMDLFRRAPAAKSMHHAYIGGLLEHSLSVAKLTTRLCDHYPDIDRDLMVAGAILHDIGKVHEFVYDFFIDYSNAGRLLGHMILGAEILEEKAKGIKGFPDEQLMVLKHLILSHHGEAEFGAVKLPMTREAFVLHFADDLDAKMNSLGRILSEPSNGEDDWTGYQQMFGRFLYRGARSGVENGAPAPDAQTKEEEPAGEQLSMWAAAGSPRRKSDG